MTIVAWDGKTLAADRRVVCSGYKGRETTKIHTWEGGLCGISGDLDTGATLLAWLLAGADAERYPQLQENEPSDLLVIYHDGRVAEFGRSPVPMFMEQRFHAIGSGSKYALAAMYLGKSAKQAVEVACALDAYCGNGINTLTLKGTRRA